MNEYYNIRYNLYKYFLNIDDDSYNYYLYIIIPILYIIVLLLSLFGLLLLQNISGFTIIYMILLICFYIITYKLIISLKSITTDETLIKYKKFYELRNIIFKENLVYASNLYNTGVVKNADINYLYSNKEVLLKNINNTENIYGNDAKKILNSSYDLLQYFDLNEYIEKGYYNRLYIKNINFMQKNLPFVIRENNIITYINFELLEDYPQQQLDLLKYLNVKYGKDFSFTSKNIFTAEFNKKLNKSISNYKINIYYYIAISVLLIIILLHGLFVYLNNILASVYLILIILLFIILYYFN